ncbi:putative ANTAR domain-containing PAS/PAC sensor protein [Gordonia polyisoprenivorans VH2]|uniref:ANTAR domain-containing protein n=2 Tax=Gordonia polyisoprenivorans TaxID=84595 RepID=A0A846WT49_9ACTN|nr:MULTISPECIES: PAS and ANTAR domain-containing protein [Gordonia]AFA75596.1 putative ANTAR domain-containing PAS/PAC sensor protein [Gordonia polyisoprenivorans VH2]NKY04317.1 ANTAR domain-containing protein [Gordonia polyisoprenivorans]OPX13098.1 diguanylate cyclase [Gordonia sp. i37]QUD83111.1 ANTAR domain-containing protein [Gordonia polyisoprenivorans]WCB37103.1 PAS and ANTAR domain-containing protein [Gordonia polyisoprenivorans]
MLDDAGRDAAFDATARAHNVGSFRFFFATQRWEWSDEVAALHGYAPGEVEPTTELMVGHKHPDDREDFERLVERMLSEHSPFSSRHRIIDTRGVLHHVVVIGHPLLDASGVAIGTEGVYLDMDGWETNVVKDQIDHHINRFRESQGVIEQTKGMIMFAYRVSAEQAFEVLKWRSQTTNVKVSSLCRSILTGSQAIEVPDAVRQDFDHLLLTAHESVDPVESEGAQVIEP